MDKIKRQLISVQKQTKPSQYDKSWSSWAICPAPGESFYKKKKNQTKLKSSERSRDNFCENYQVQDWWDAEKGERTYVLLHLPLKVENKHSRS